MLQQQQKWHEDQYLGMQSYMNNNFTSIQSYMDNNFASMRSYIDNKNEDVMNRLDDLESKLEVITCSQLQDVPSSSSGHKALF